MDLSTPFETCQKEKYVCNHFWLTTAIVCTVIFPALFSSQRPDSENDSVLDDSALDDSERDDSQKLGGLMAQGVCVNRQYCSCSWSWDMFLIYKVKANPEALAHHSHQRISVTHQADRSDTKQAASRRMRMRTVATAGPAPNTTAKAVLAKLLNEVKVC